MGPLIASNGYSNHLSVSYYPGNGNGNVWQCVSKTMQLHLAAFAKTRQQSVSPS